MDAYRKLADNLNSLLNPNGNMAIYQGIVKKVHGNLCDLLIGNILIEDVRLKASETTDDGEILLVPAIGSAVTVGSLSGDLSQLVVIAVDKVDSIKVTGSITINGGKLGGMVNVKALTSKLNEFVREFNLHTHTTPNGMSGTPQAQATNFKASDYEDDKIKH
jgi:hypothetical protein